MTTAELKAYAFAMSKPASNRRSLRSNFALAKGRDLRGKLILGVLFAMPAFAIYATNLLMAAIHNLVELNAQSIDKVQPVVTDLTTVAFLFIAIILLLCLIAIYFVFFLSVRVFGPQVALLNFIDQLKAGDYRPYRKLRKDDELQEIWQALQDLALKLGASNTPAASGEDGP